MNRRTNARGFTLIEVMIVIAIILALTTIVGIAVLGRKSQADTKLAQVDLNNIKHALDQFKLDFGRWPTEEEGIKVLWDKESLDPDADQSQYLSGGYLKEPMPKDRWGNEWHYRFPSARDDETQYDLWSSGPNGEDEDGQGDDLISWHRDADEGGFDDGLLPPSDGSSSSGP